MASETINKQLGKPQQVTDATRNAVQISATLPPFLHYVIFCILRCVATSSAPADCIDTASCDTTSSNKPELLKLMAICATRATVPTGIIYGFYENSSQVIVLCLLKKPKA